MPEKKVLVGISVGDVHGIGVEIIMNAFTKSNLLDKCIPIIFCPHQIFADYLKLINSVNSDISFIKSFDDITENKINVFQTEKFQHKVELGKPSQDSALIAYKSLEISSAYLKNQMIDSLVTAPIDKYQIRKSAPNFIGHTEYLENQFEGKSLMVMLSEKMKIAFISGHIPLNEVSENIKEDKIINKTIQLNNSLKKDFKISNPKIAVLGLNPHAGENGMFGDEETKTIAPAIEDAKKKGILASGPYSPDTIFLRHQAGEFDAVVAMYHDQALVPLKLMGFGKSVNITLGLPLIRTSVDHGTAFDRAANFNSDSSSMEAAIQSALRLCRNSIVAGDAN